MRQRLMMLGLALAAGLVPLMAQRMPWGKLSGGVRRVAMAQADGMSRRAKGMPAGRASRMIALVSIEGDADSVLAAHDCRKMAQWGRVCVAGIPLSCLASLARSPHIMRIEANAPCSLTLDTTAVLTRMEPVRRGTSLPQAYTGKGVILGHMDIGYDLTHPNFRASEGGGSRIVRLWDQLAEDTCGHLPVGRDYTTGQEIAALGRTFDGETMFHGTYTLGIAAGTGCGTAYQGMAPGSELCLVANAVSNNADYIKEEKKDLYTTATDVLGWKYIFDYADERGLPCVISMSEGSRETFEEDDVLMEEALEQMTGPGRIFVASSGNEGRSRRYFHKSADEPRKGTFIYTAGDHINATVRSKSTDMDIRLRLWKSGTDSHTFLLEGRRMMELRDSVLRDTVELDGKEYRLTTVGYRSAKDSTDCVFEYLLESEDGVCKERVPSVELLGEHVEADFYNGTGELATSSYDSGLDAGQPGYNAYTPSTAPAAISVGATAHRTAFTNYAGTLLTTSYGKNGERATYSSFGPTTDGRIKPDVVANGTHLVSSMSSFFHQQQGNDYWDIADSIVSQGRVYPWHSDCGTSGSTPVVAGIIATWLEANPMLTPQDVKGVMSRTCRHLEGMAYPNHEYGWGEIDAYAGLLDVLQLATRIDGLSAVHPQGVGMAMSAAQGMILTLGEASKGATTVDVYALDGRKVATHSFPAGTSVCEIPLGALPKGVYAVQLNSRETRGSWLVRN